MKTERTDRVQRQMDRYIQGEDGDLTEAWLEEFLKPKPVPEEAKKVIFNLMDPKDQIVFLLTKKYPGDK